MVREGQRKIMLGKGGETIKLISQSAREELSKLFETKVHLFLFVKVRENWGDDPSRYRATWGSNIRKAGEPCCPSERSRRRPSIAT